MRMAWSPLVSARAFTLCPFNASAGARSSASLRWNWGGTRLPLRLRCTAKAMVADLVPARLRGTAYGSYHTLLGIIDLPASLIAGVLWQGIGSWQGFGPAAPFYFGAATALAAALLLPALLRDAE